MINLINVSKSFGNSMILNRINVTFEDGKIYGLIGQNGCGKTTLLRCICGFCKPTSGKIIVNGKKIGENCDFPTDVGVVIDTPSFLPFYSGFTNLSILASMSRKITKDQIKQTMMQVGLDPNNRQTIRKYSLGMRQRLAIAQAIMEDPKLLILDEPFNGLDADGVKDMCRLFQEKRSEGKTIILACHNFSELFDLCDEVFKIENGKLQFSENVNMLSIQGERAIEKLWK